MTFKTFAAALSAAGLLAVVAHAGALAASGLRVTKLRSPI